MIFSNFTNVNICHLLWILMAGSLVKKWLECAAFRAANWQDFKKLIWPHLIENFVSFMKECRLEFIQRILAFSTANDVRSFGRN